MRNVLILGASGSIARHAIDLFLKKTDTRLTLYLRDPRKLRNVNPSRTRVIEGDVMDTAKLKEAMAGQDVVQRQRASPIVLPLVKEYFVILGSTALCTSTGTPSAPRIKFTESEEGARTSYDSDV